MYLHRRLALRASLPHRVPQGAAALVVGGGRLHPRSPKQYTTTADESTFLLLYEYVEDMTVRRTSYRAAHLALAQLHKEQGKVVMGGAFADARLKARGGGEKKAGAAYVFQVPRREDVEEFVRADPYFEHGLVSHYTVKEWQLLT